MSFWYEVKSIGALELDGDEINIFLEKNNQGNVYVTVPIKIIKELLEGKE